MKDFAKIMSSDKFKQMLVFLDKNEEGNDTVVLMTDVEGFGALSSTLIRKPDKELSLDYFTPLQVESMFVRMLDGFGVKFNSEGIAVFDKEDGE